MPCAARWCDAVHEWAHHLRRTYTRAKVIVRLVRGRDLLAADHNVLRRGPPTSDPYCNITLGDQTRTSKVRKRTLNPDWDETFEFKGQLRWLVNDDAPLLIECFDEDQFSADDPLGEVVLPLVPIFDTLVAANAKGGAVEKVLSLDTKGELHVELSAWTQPLSWTMTFAHWMGLTAVLDPIRRFYYENVDATFRVHLMRGINLKAADGSRVAAGALGSARTSDPYVKLTLGDRGHRQQGRSRTIYKTVHPVWDETIEFHGRVADLHSESMTFEVWDEDKINFDDFLGVARIEEYELEEALDDAAYELGHVQGEAVAPEASLLRTAEADPTTPEELSSPRRKLSAQDASKQLIGAQRLSSRAHFHKHYELPLNTKGTLNCTLEIELHATSFGQSILGAACRMLSLDQLEGGLDLSPRAVHRYLRRVQREASILTLSVSVQRAAHLRGADSDGLSDPYTSVRCLEQVRTTKIVKNSLHPVWNETFTFTNARGAIEGTELVLQVYDDDRFNSDDWLGEVAIPIRTADVTELLRDGTIKEAWYDLKGQGSIEVGLRATVQQPSLLAVAYGIARPVLMWGRAFLLYRRQPYDRTVWAKLQDPTTFVLMVIVAQPNVFVRGTFFTLLLAAIMREREEFQLMQFILALKGTQFLSGLIKLGTLCLGLWMCTIQTTCETSAPGVAHDGTILASLAMIVWLQVLVWFAFLMLPYTGQFQPHSAAVSYDRAEKLWARNEAHVRGRLLAGTAASQRSGWASPFMWTPRMSDVGGALTSVGKAGLDKFRASLTSTVSTARRAYKRVDAEHEKRTMPSPSLSGNDKVIVTLHSGQGLMACDSNGLSDPFARVTLDGRKFHKTKVCGKTLDPVWEETFEWVGDRASLCQSPLVIAVYDRDMLSRNDPMGNCSVDLEELYDLEGGEDDIPLTLELGDVPGCTGAISITVAFEEHDKDALYDGDRDEGDWVGSPGRTGSARAHSPSPLPAPPLHKRPSSSLARDPRVPPLPLAELPAEVAAAIPPGDPPPLWFTLLTWPCYFAGVMIASTWRSGRVQEARIQLLTLIAPLADAKARTENRMLVLLIWDKWMSIGALLLLGVMLALPVYNAALEESRLLDDGVSSYGVDVHLRSLVAAMGALFDIELYATWHSKITLQVVKLFFALSAFPFFLFTTGGLAKLFTHTDPTGYTPEGRIVQKDTNGLSSYLEFLKANVLSVKTFKVELQQRLTDKEYRRLKGVIKEGERCLEAAWKQPSTRKRVTKRKMQDLDAIVASLITRERFSLELYRTLYPDKVVVDSFLAANEDAPGGKKKKKREENELRV